MESPPSYSAWCLAVPSYSYQLLCQDMERPNQFRAKIKFLTLFPVMKNTRSPTREALDFVSGSPWKARGFGNMSTWKVDKKSWALLVGLGKDWETTESRKRKIRVGFPVWLEQPATQKNVLMSTVTPKLTDLVLKAAALCHSHRTVCALSSAAHGMECGEWTRAGNRDTCEPGVVGNVQPGRCPENK